ncbi:MAG: hypothetical protein CMN06_13675 [Roseibacillus sp.]|nr:hypothetical protein [Roseibacillus sp.]|tara:strand:+ start:3750 stop:4583 length:834 start_codon:yes stop_codon:yes gene_type:complete
MKILLVVVGSLLVIACRDNNSQTGGSRMDIEEAFDSSFASQHRGPKEGSSDDGEKAFAYLREVLLNKEFGAGSGSIVRWIESPDVVLVEGSESSRAVLNRVTKQLNDALEGTPTKLESVIESKRDRRIEVFMVPGSRFRAIGRTRGFKVQGKQDGYVWVFWDTRKKFIQRATVMVAVDRIDGDLLEHVLLEELTQSLGPLGDTTILPESVMFQRGSNHGRASKLSDWDCRMLKLLYGHLKPGDEEAEVREAYHRFWKTGLNRQPTKEKSSNTMEERP